ncbi:MAG: FMN-binding glutamate synthase family protein [Atopobiaceae bacterium]|nr:FMN-binding glutamate synthase family protein [Atopobiaceae bacterium]
MSTQEGSSYDEEASAEPSAEAKVAFARGASAVGTAMYSGEGGILPAEREASTRYIFEIAPLRYSVSDESLRAADAIEIKIGQGTKPGMGGHLPGQKVTEEIARIRGRQPGEDIVSSSTFPGVESVEDLRALVDEMRERSGGAPVGIKLAAGHIERDIDRAHAAGADFITIDGRGGATGASPVMLRDAASVPTMYALVRARRRLDALGSRASLVITGGLRVASDVVKALALGADAVALASASLMALGCQQYRICGSGMCPVGIATQDPELRERRDWDAAAQRVENFYRATFDDLKMFCRVMGHERISKLSVDDLVTVNPDLAERLGIPRA